MLGLSAEAFEDCKHQKTAAHKAKHHTVARVEFNSNTLKTHLKTLFPSTLAMPKLGNSATDDSFHREPLLPQRVTSSKPCTVDSTIPTHALQAVKVSFFGHLGPIGISARLHLCEKGVAVRCAVDYLKSGVRPN
jgi:hypothetical protein